MENKQSPFSFSSDFSIKLSDYENNYLERLTEFLAANEDNTELYFISQEKDKCIKHNQDIKECINGLSFNSENREDYIVFLRNRIFPFNENNYDEKVYVDNELVMKISDDGKVNMYVKELKSLLNNRHSTNHKIKLFLDSREKIAETNLLNPKPQENYNSKSKSVSYHIEKEKHSHIFKGEAFKIWEYMYYEFDVTDSSRSDVKFIFTNMKKDNHIHQTVGQKSFLDWISETYQKEIGKTSADVESKYRRNVYRDALETIKN